MPKNDTFTIMERRVKTELILLEGLNATEISRKLGVSKAQIYKIFSPTRQVDFVKM